MAEIETVHPNCRKLRDEHVALLAEQSDKQRRLDEERNKFTEEPVPGKPDVEKKVPVPPDPEITEPLEKRLAELEPLIKKARDDLDACIARNPFTASDVVITDDKILITGTGGLEVQDGSLTVRRADGRVTNVASEIDRLIVATTEGSVSATGGSVSAESHVGPAVMGANTGGTLKLKKSGPITIPDPGSPGPGVLGKSFVGEGVRGEGGIGVSGTGTVIGVFGEGATGVHGKSTGSGDGVIGEGANGPGVHGTSKRLGVLGSSDGDSGSAGVEGHNMGSGAGIMGRAFGSGIGVRGVSSRTGVSGEAADVGVQGKSDAIGVLGVAQKPNGIALKGVADKEGSLALSVEGRAHFSSAGFGLIMKGEVQALVPQPLVTDKSHISVTLITNPGLPISVKFVEDLPGEGFLVHLTAPATETVGLSYLVVEIVHVKSDSSSPSKKGGKPIGGPVSPGDPTKPVI